MTSEELVQEHALLLSVLFMDRLREGEELEDLVSILIDSNDESVPPALRDALDIQGDTEDGGSYELGTMYRSALADTLAGMEDEIADQLHTPTSIHRVPCVVFCDGTIDLYFYILPVLRLSEGGDA